MGFSTPENALAIFHTSDSSMAVRWRNGQTLLGVIWSSILLANGDGQMTLRNRFRKGLDL